MNNSSIWITGASAGIGKALVEKFTENDFHTFASARRIELLKDFFDKNNLVESIKCDVSKFAEVERVVSEIEENHKIDCLINNAGITSFKPFVNNDIEEINNIITTNLLGSIYTIKNVLPKMIERKNGTIINILSVAAKKIFTNSSVYAASKSGLESFTKVLREEMRDKNIRIINVFPGATKTEIWPDSAINKYGDLMMDPTSLADLIFDVYQSDAKITAEEIIVRPITGDL